MPKSIKQELEKVQKHILKRNFESALEELELIENSEKLSTVEKVSYQILKSTICSNLEHFDDALRIAENALKKSRTLGNSLLEVDAIIAKLRALGVEENWWGETIDGYLYFKPLDQMSKLIRLAERGEKILESIAKLPTKERKKRKAILKKQKGLIYRKRGKIDLSI